MIIPFADVEIKAQRGGFGVRLEESHREEGIIRPQVHSDSAFYCTTFQGNLKK